MWIEGNQFLLLKKFPAHTQFPIYIKHNNFNITLPYNSKWIQSTSENI